MDKILQTLLIHTQNEWPKSKNEGPNLIRNYFIHWQDLTYSNGIIFKGTCLIVPKSLCEDTKHALNVGHLGIAKIKEKTRDIIYWPGINADLENIVNSCDTCQEYQNQQKDKNPIVHESLRKLFQIMNLNIMEKITNCLQNNSTLNMTHQVLITKSNEQIERTIPTIKKTLKKKWFKSNGDSYLFYSSTNITRSWKHHITSNVTFQQNNKNNFTINEYKYSSN